MWVLQNIHKIALVGLKSKVVSAAAYNFGEGKTNPDKVRQKFLGAFFGPTAIGTSIFRAIRNTMMPLFWFTGMNLVFNTREFTKLWSTVHIKSFADVLLSTPFLQIRMFRIINTLYFTATGWMVFYIVWKWSNNAPIIAGKKRKRSLAADQRFKEMEEIIELSYQRIISRLEKTNQNSSVSDRITDE